MASPTQTTMSSSTSPLKTYHHTCSHLLLATTYKLETLPRRKANSSPPSDNALILPVHVPSSRNDDESDDEDAPSTKDKAANPNLTLLLPALTPSKNPIMIRRTDGFEKRLLLRCARCRGVVAYRLVSEESLVGGSAAGSEENAVQEDPMRKEGFVYVLPGALVETSIMMGLEKGKSIESVAIGKGDDIGWSGVEV